MRNRFSAALLMMFLVQPTAADEMNALSAERDERVYYAMGLLQARELRTLHFSEREFERYMEGLQNGFAHAPKVSLSDWLGEAVLAKRGRERARLAEEKRASEQFLALAASEAGASAFESGLIFTELKPGYGATPSPESRVTFHYHGTVRDGTVFDSSMRREEAATISLANAIPCWREGLQHLRVGGRAKLVCPAALAYGDSQPSPVIIPGAVVTYEIELLTVH
jgi:FKBP-type peptidyl-prolyl cis-trans isomerase